MVGFHGDRKCAVPRSGRTGISEVSVSGVEHHTEAGTEAEDSTEKRKVSRT